MSSRRQARKSPKQKKRVPEVRYPTNWIIDRPFGFPAVGKYDNATFNLVDSVESLSWLTTGTATNSFQGFFAALSDLPDASNYAAVFDQYKIMGVEIQLSPSVAPLGGVYTGHIHTVIDYDDIASITPAAALNYNNCIVSNLQDTLIRTYKPHMAVAAYSGTFASYANMNPQWIDCASPSVQHYGFKCAVNPTTTALSFDLIAKIWIQFRNSR
jgi:hypothetical protein